jgi:putative oxidoreductase
MKDRMFSISPYFLSIGFAAIRVITGMLMTYHGIEVLDGNKMYGYGQWLTDLRFPQPHIMAYLGKGTELVSGVLLVLGLFTRLAALALAVTMLLVCFGIGKGRIFTDDQHPFLFVLLAAFGYKNLFA